MAVLTWDPIGERLYETGTSKGVIYVVGATGEYGAGVAWNGLASVKQSPDGADESPFFANNQKYLSLLSSENFKGSIEAYTYPEEFAACDGSKELVAASGVYLGQQNRAAFGLVYSTVIGNDTEGDNYGEKIHVIYGAKVSPASRDYVTINQDPNALLFSWEFTTTPQSVEGFKPTSYLCIDSTKIAAAKLTQIKTLLYGSASVPAALPSIDEIITLLEAVG